MGGDLMTLLKEEPVLSEDSVHGFACDIAMALQHMHSNGLVSPGVFTTVLAVYTNIAGKRRGCTVCNTAECPCPHACE